MRDAKAAYERAIALGAWGYAHTAGPGELNIPAIKGIGDSIIYFIDKWRGKGGAQPGDIGNIGFYERLFNFREVRYFDIEGQSTGVKSKAMTSPCGKIRIPINEEGNERAGQIQEYLDKYHGEGNFKALFETMELDQMRRGVLQTSPGA